VRMICHQGKHVFCVALLALITSGTARAAKDSCSAFVDVTVVHVDKEREVPHQTVLLRDARIARVAPARDTTLPPGCLAIDGRNRYLIPGLIDSHVHLPLTGRADQVLVLHLLLANGITTGVNMEGSVEILSLRNEIRQGSILAPTIYSTGPFIQEPSFTRPEQVIHEVIFQKRAGYDLIKVHGDLPKEAYDALFATAAKNNIRVVGHVPSNLGIDAALGRQALIVHAEEFLYSYFQFHRDLPTDSAEIERMVAEISKKTAWSGTWVSPTLSVFRQIIFQAADIDALLQRPEMRYMPRHLTTGAAVGATNFGWYPPDNPYVKRWPPEKIPRLRTQYSVMQRLVRGLRDAGVPLLAGTDPFVPCVIPGFSMKDELEQLYEAGLTPYQVLQTATSNAARFLGTADSTGTIARGKVADLVLLDANPLLDVDSIFQQDGVMLRGHWLPEDEVRTKLAEAASASNASVHP
jgi:hypothetical protein